MVSPKRSVYSPAFFLSAIVIVILICLVCLRETAEAQAKGTLFSDSSGSTVTGPRIWLADSQTVAVQTADSETLLQKVATGEAQPLSMVTAEVDGDGYPDLLTGFSTATGGAIVVHRGNVDAFAPQSNATLRAIGHGQFPFPFLPGVRILNIPVRPDFMAFGRFTSSGHEDLVVAARGGNSLYVFPGDGKGKFGTPQIVAVSGAVTSLAAERLLRSLQFSNVLVGVAVPHNSSLLVFTGSMRGLGSPARFPFDAAPTNIVFGDYGDSYTDAAFLAGGNVFVLHSSSFQVEQIPLPVSASALALGSFIFDRNSVLQMALLTSDGIVHIATHAEFDPRPLTMEEHQTRLRAARRGFGNPLNAPRTIPQNGWQIVESIPAAAPFASGPPPVFFRTRLSDQAADDIMVLDPSLRQLVVISHPKSEAGATTFAPAQVSTRPYNGAVVAALPMRTNIDNRPGIVALHQGQLAPAVMMPLPDPTFFVNRTDDPTPGAVSSTCNNVSNADTSFACSLREAVLKANATPGTDTIILAAGTYTLTIARVNGDNTGAHGGLYINDSLNVVGAGQASTIIQGGTSAPTGVDLVFAVNEDIQTITNASASFSNLAIKFGHNRGSVAGTDGDGGCMEYDTGSSGTATLTLTNVTISNCVTQDGNGGGIAIFNASSGGSGGTGLATITNSIFQNNSVAEAGAGSAGSGGGIWVADLARMSMSNTQVINNTATQVNGSGRGVAGGIFIFSAGSGSRQTAIHGSTITGNNASGFGGGIWSSSNLLIDNTGGATVVSGNAAGANGGGAQNGGGIYLNSASPDSTTLTKVIVTSNTATGNGGGIATGNDTGAGPLTMHFSRLAGNTASTANNLDNDNTSVTATNNWWGTNSPANTITSRNGGVATFTPFAQLTNTASLTTIRIDQSATLTADLSKDNNGSGTALAGNLDILAGLPITFDNAILGTIPQAQPEALNASAQATATLNAGSTSGIGHADATVDQETVVANITILEPLQITKSFNSTTILVNTSSTLTFAVNNPNVVTLDASFTDTLPAGVVVAATPGVTNTCGGTLTATAGSGSISFSNASLPVGACTITVKVSSATEGVYNNIVTINSAAAGTGASSTSSATLTVINPPSITKVFGAATLPLNGSTSLSFTITNSNTASSLAGTAFTDSLPAGLVVATTPTLNNTCGGTATAAAGSSSVSLSAATLAAGASCTVSVNVQGTNAGVKNNSVTVSSTNGGTGNTSNASITVASPPVISKAFGAASIPLNLSTSLSVTVQNNNTTTTLASVGFSDTLPAGLVVSTPNGLTGTCGTGTITATAATNVISLSGASIAASSSCTLSVNVTGIAAGLQNNTTGNVTSTQGGTGGTASASVKVEAPPSIAKVFNPASVALHATASLTFTTTNPATNVDPLTGVAFTDTLPTGLTVANAAATVCGGTLTTTAPTGIALIGATIAVNSQCQFSVTVTGAASGQFTNTTGSVTSTNGGAGNTASANLIVATAPSISNAFGAATIPLNGTTFLTLAINNPNTSLALTGLAFTDNLPGGLIVGSTPTLSNTCGGTATATSGGSTVSLSGGTLASSGACTVLVNVQGVTVGVKNNSVSVISTEAGTGNTANASTTVVGPPVINKAFGAASVPLNGSTSLSFTVQNNNTTTTLTNVAFTDSLPAGLTVSAPNGLTGSCGGGTIATTAGSVSLSGASLAATSSCTFSVNVTGTSGGLKNNTTGSVTSTEGGTGGTASASVKAEAPPSLAKVFNPAAIALNATSSLTFTITNPTGNADPLTGVAIGDTLPTGLTVANASATVCGGTLTTTAPTGVALTGATIAVNSQCQFSVTVAGAVSGQYKNTTGNVTSANGGTGNTATANLTVATAPVIVKAFAPSSIALNGSTSLSFTISNPVTNPFSLTGIAFTDNLPAGLSVSTPHNLSNTCGGTLAASGGGSIVSLIGGTVPSSSSCIISLNVTGTTAGVKNNSVTVTSIEAGAGNTSNASVTVVASPTIAKVFGAASIPLNGTTPLSFTVQNVNPASGLSGVGFTDALPLGLAVANPNGATGNCGGGAISAAPGASTVSLSGGSLVANSSCTFSVNVTGTTAGTKNNTTGLVTSIQGGNGGTASASLDVVAPPLISKTFSPAVVAPNTHSTLTFNIINPTANSVALVGVAFVDALPTGLTVSTPNGFTGSCASGVITAAAGTGTIGLSGATIPAGGSCNFGVNVVGPAGSYTNTTGVVTSTNGGAGNIATASLTVGAAPVLVETFGAASIGLRASTTLSFTITNPNSSLALNGVAFDDSLPSGLVVATPAGLTGTCGNGTINAVTGSQLITFSGASIAASGSCAFSVNVTAISAGNQVSLTGNVSSANGGIGNAATASLTVLAPDITISETHTGNFFQGQTNASYTISVANIGAGPTGGAVTVTEVPPAAFSVASLSGTGWTCNVGALSCSRSEALSAKASYPAITVTGTIATSAAGTISNSVTVAGGGELNLGNDSAADLATVTAPPDFTLSLLTSSIIIRAGSTATYKITATPQNNNLSASITFRLVGVPTKSTFSLTPASVTLGTSAKTVSLSIATSAGDPFIARHSPNHGPLLALLLPISGLMFSGFGFRKRSRTRGKGGWWLGVALFFSIGIFMTGCASVQNFQRLGTPPGSYTVTVTATSGSIQHSLPVTLIVEP